MFEVNRWFRERAKVTINCDDTELDKIAVPDENKIDRKYKLKYLMFDYLIENKLFLKERMAATSWFKRLEMEFRYRFGGYNELDGI